LVPVEVFDEIETGLLQIIREFDGIETRHIGLAQSRHG
jgi:hypothetical protein